MSFVGLDLGGTYIKAAVLHDGSVQEPVVRVPCPSFIDATGPKREISPERLVDAARDALRQLPNAEPEGLLVSGQMAGSVITNAAGRALSPVITWQDLRVDSAETQGAHLGPELIARTGNELRPGLPIVTLTAVKVPVQARWTSIMGYVAGALCDEFAAALHVSDAASSGFFDLIEDDWSEHALASVGLTIDQVPRATHELIPVGFTDELQCPVFCSVGDQQAALLGAGLEKDELSVNIGTGGQVSVRSESTSTEAQLRPYFSRDYLHTVTHLPSGRHVAKALASLLEREPQPSDWDWVRMALDAGSIDVARLKVALDDVAHAVIEASAQLDKMTRIRFTGGLVQSFPYLRDAILRILQLPYVTFAGDDAALAGLAKLSGSLRR
jgi:xylulokinase